MDLMYPIQVLQQYQNPINIYYILNDYDHDDGVHFLHKDDHDDIFNKDYQYQL